MPHQVFRHDRPDRCVVGTVGEPGQRTFFLQARSGSRVTSVVVEKVQVAALADRLESLLDDLDRRRAGAQPPGPDAAAVDDLAPLDVPLEEEFRAVSLGLAFQAATGEVEIVAAAEDDDADADAGSGEASAGEDDRGGGAEPSGDQLVVRLSGEQARSFVRRARAVVAAGRAPCPLCAQPLDPSGHVCPRQNGYRRRP